MEGCRREALELSRDKASCFGDNTALLERRSKGRVTIRLPSCGTDKEKRKKKKEFLLWELSLEELGRR